MFRHPGKEYLCSISTVGVCLCSLISDNEYLCTISTVGVCFHILLVGGNILPPQLTNTYVP